MEGAYLNKISFKDLILKYLIEEIIKEEGVNNILRNCKKTLFLNEFAIIQITGKRKNNDNTSITDTIIQLIVFCFFVSMFFSLLIFSQNSLYNSK